MNSINQDWVSWLDSSGNLVMAEKQRTSGSGAQVEINDASTSGAQDESDEGDFVTITGIMCKHCGMLMCFLCEFLCACV